MSGYHYQISEASRLLAVEAHVLRYWEEELGMIIPRNEMGHRYYTEDHLRIFSQIKDMKERGYQLRAIRAILSGEEAPEPVITEIPLKKEESVSISGTKYFSGAEMSENSRKASLTGKAESIREAEQRKSVREVGKRSYAQEVEAEEAVYEAGKRPYGQEVETREVVYEAGKRLYAQEVEAGEAVREVGKRSCGQEAEAEEAVREVGKRAYAQEVERQKSPEERMNQFQAVMTHIVAQAMLCNNRSLAQEISCQVEGEVLRKLQDMLDTSENRQEERFRKLDETLRSIQEGNRARYEAAASKAPGKFWRRKHRKIKNRRI